MKSYVYLLICLYFLNIDSAFSQKNEIGLQLNAFNYQGDIGLINAPYLPETQPGIGIYYRNSFHNNFSAKLGANVGRISGDDRNYDDRTDINPSVSFQTNLLILAGNLEWNIVGRERRNLKVYDAEGRRIPYEELAVTSQTLFDADGNQLGERPRLTRSVVPYFTAGLGAVFFDPEVTLNDPANHSLTAKELNKDYPQTNFMTPFGVGFKFYLSDHWVLGLEALMIPTHSDYIDGVSDSRNPNENDWLSSLSLGIGYRFGERDRDGDGVPDKVDRCPDQPGPAALAGCPDRDGDGIADIDDLCPDEPGPASTGGCPDRDGDGIADKDDRCPDEAGPAKFAGCPDRDGDGIPDIDDRCPDEPGPMEFAGCPDRDGDGIPDIDDRCPDQPGPAALAGCPDRDGDGVPDIDDRCPDAPGPVALQGCPDRDGDGVADIDDKCPDVPGPASNFGCPEISKEDKEKIEFAIQNVTFRTGTARLSSASLPLISDLANIMKKYPVYHLEIEGHTDNTGSAALNQTLSENRAKACYDQLRTLGISDSRMSYRGFGPSKPIASNDTEAGRTLNRRTEFKMVIK